MSILEQIVGLEWEMMKEVNNIGGKAICQKDKEKFVQMRMAQLSLWSEDTKNSYKQDLVAAVDSGRNLVEEKYAYMLEYSDRELFEKNKKLMGKVSEEKMLLVKELTDLAVEEQRLISKKYPLLSKTGRPLRSKSDTQHKISFETYHRSELITYSIRTLELLKEDYLNYKKEHKSIAYLNLNNIVKSLGYKNVEEAEEHIRTLANE